MEVVLANGEIMRTGMAAVPGAETWADNKYGFGAYVDGLFAQANFGIVTRMGFWMQPAPDHFLAAMVKVPRYRDLVALIDGVNHMEDQGLVGHPRYACPMDPLCMQMEPEVYRPTPELMELNSQPGGASVEKYEAYARNHGLEFWNVLLNFYGPKETIQASWAFAQNLFGGIPDVQFERIEDYADPLRNQKAASSVRHKVALGIPKTCPSSLSAHALRRCRSRAMVTCGSHLSSRAPAIPSCVRMKPSLRQRES